MWNCVETEVVEENFLRRRERELIFDNVYESETALRKHNPIRVTKENIKYGDKVTFVDKNNLTEGYFVCSSETIQFEPEQLICHVLNSESELRRFAKRNSIGNMDEHIFSIVIKSFKFLTKKLSKNRSLSDVHLSVAHVGKEVEAIPDTDIKVEFTAEEDFIQEVSLEEDQQVLDNTVDESFRTDEFYLGRGGNATSSQQLVARLTESKGLSSAGLSLYEQKNDICKVCGDVSTGLHYGVETCEGCKGFFRRTLKKQTSYRSCVNSELCLLNMNRRNRTQCPSCRFRKCIDVGMSRAHMDETKARYQKRRTETPNQYTIGQPSPKSFCMDNSVSDVSDAVTDQPVKDHPSGLLHQILNGQVSLESMRNDINNSSPKSTNENSDIMKENADSPNPPVIEPTSPSIRNSSLFSTSIFPTSVNTLLPHTTTE